jgi:hypothetical protein
VGRNWCISQDSLELASRRLPGRCELQYITAELPPPATPDGQWIVMTAVVDAMDGEYLEQQGGGGVVR